MEIDTEDIHRQFREHKSFEQLVLELDDEKEFFRYRSAVEGIGREVAAVYDWFDPDVIGYVALGEMWLQWEAYHSDKQPAKLEGGTP